MPLENFALFSASHRELVKRQSVALRPHATLEHLPTRQFTKERKLRNSSLKQIFNGFCFSLIVE